MPVYIVPRSPEQDNSANKKRSVELLSLFRHSLSRIIDGLQLS